MQRAMFATVDEVGRVVADEGIDARYHKGGTLTLATSEAQLLRLQDEIEHEREWGFGEADYAYLTADETAAAHAGRRLPGRDLLAALRLVDPARLARGLAEVVERLGVTIYERTPGARPDAARGAHARWHAQGRHRRERARRLCAPCPVTPATWCRCTR